MPAVQPEEIGNIYVLGPPEEDKPRQLVQLNKLPKTLAQIIQDIRDYVPDFNDTITISPYLAQFSVGKFTLFFLPDRKDQTETFKILERCAGSPVKVNTTVEPPGLIIFLSAFVTKRICKGRREKKS